MRYATIVALVISVCAAPVFAQDGADAVDKKLQQLEEAQQRLTQQQSALEQEIQKIKEARLEDATDKKVATEGKKISLDLEYKDGFKMSSKDGRFKFQIGGRLQVDFRKRIGEDDPLINTWEVRRTWIFAAGTLYKYYKWFIQFDINRGASLFEAFSDLTHFAPNATLRLGQFSQPFGLEGIQSNKYVRPIERSMVTNFTNPFYDVGAMLYGSSNSKVFNWWVSYYNGAGRNTRDVDDHKDVAARIVLRPGAGSDNKFLKGLHVGVAGTFGNHQRSVAGAGPSTAVYTPVWRYDAGVREDGVVTRLGAEVAWHVGPFGLQAEWIKYRQDLDLGAGGTPSGHHETQGGYVTLTYLLTGEDEGMGRIHPRNNVEPGHADHGMGAWQLVARWGIIESDDHKREYLTENSAHRAQQIMAGFNWWMTPMVKVSVNWQHAWFERAVKGTKTEDSIIFRYQLEF